MEPELDHIPLSSDAMPKLIESLNGRYKDALKVFAKHFCSKPAVATARIIEIEEGQCKLRCWDADSQCEEATVGYANHVGRPVVARSAGDIRRILVDMARSASEATGEELALPCGASIGSHECEKVPGAYLLNDLVDMKKIECLNQDCEHPVTNAICNSLREAATVADDALQSDPDVDHQLLIKVGFRLPIKLKAITIGGNVENETAPKIVKVFQGQANMEFQDAEDQEATQVLELSASHVAGDDPVMLRFVKFQHVITLQLFVESNFGADITRIEHLKFWGTPAEVVDMKAWKPISGDVSNAISPIWEPAEKDEASGV